MDDQGNMRAKLNVSGEGMTHLGLYDQQGIEREPRVGRVAEEVVDLMQPPPAIAQRGRDRDQHQRDRHSARRYASARRSST